MLLLLIGCAPPPPDAPDNLEELCEFLFAHLADEETDELVAGVENLNDWLLEGDNLAQASEGYSVYNLTEESVSSLDETARVIQDSLVGASVAYELDYDVSTIAQTLFVENWGEVSGSTYEFYERTFEGDPSCLPDRECDWLEYDTHSISSWVGGMITAESLVHGQIRWVETSLGWALLQRLWLTGPIDVTPDVGMEVNAQYYVHVSHPSSKGTLRTQSMWFDAEYGELIFDEDWGKNKIIDSMKGENQVLKDWLDENN